MVVDVAETVPGARLRLVGAESLQQFERLLAVAERPLVISELGVEPADRVQGCSLPETVAYGHVYRQRALGMAERLGVAAFYLKDQGQRVFGVALAGAVS